VSDDLRREVEETRAQEAAERAREAEDKAAKKKAAAPDEPTFTARDVKTALHLNELGDADLFVRMFRGRLAYDNKMARWYRFNGVCWEEDTGRNHVRAVCELSPLYEKRATAYGKVLAEKGQLWATTGEGSRVKALEKKRDAYLSRAAALRGDSRIGRVLKMASAGAGTLGLRGDEWNQHPTLFVCANKVLDLETGRARDADPGLMINMASSQVTWEGIHAARVKWLAFLDQVFERNEDLIDYMRRVAGYWLTGLINIQEFWCLWGPRGRNGKGVFFRILRAAMGDYYTTIPTELLLNNGKPASSGGPREDLVRMRSRRLGVASESSKKAVFSDDAIKNLTGGDPILCRANYGSFVEYTPEFKLLFATNRIPRVDGGDGAFRQRLRVIPFNCQFLPGVADDPDRKIYRQDPQLEEKIIADELPGVLAWMVSGSIDVLKDFTLTPPAIVAQETDEYMDSQDLVGEFIKTCLDVTDGAKGRRTQSSDIYESFRTWCADAKHIAEKFIPTHISFGQDLKARNEIKRVPPMNLVVYNVTIKSDWAPEQGTLDA
jgi:putative DNA primase/helicase